VSFAVLKVFSSHSSLS